MQAHVFFWPIFAVAAAHLWFADIAYKEFEATRGVQKQKLRGFFGASPNIAAMLSDKSLPTGSDSARFARNLKISRILRRLFPFVVVVMLVLLGLFVER